MDIEVAQTPCQSGPGLPEDLRAFLNSGQPPVAFTLGTGMAHAAEFFKSAVAACTAANTRGLLLTKFPNVIPPSLPQMIKHCTFAPFEQLLPQCAAIVHHGGIGTTAAALQSACPQLVVPLAWDQPDNAARVKRLGVGLTLGQGNRTSEHMARALARLMTPAVLEMCRQVATLAAQDNGLEVAADWVEQMASR
jgi:UDP:flavonoid glycosyltransferase YjiC (YdhE family)